MSRSVFTFGRTASSLRDLRANQILPNVQYYWKRVEALTIRWTIKGTMMLFFPPPTRTPFIFSCLSGCVFGVPPLPPMWISLTPRFLPPLHTLNVPSCRTNPAQSVGQQLIEIRWDCEKHILSVLRWLNKRMLMRIKKKACVHLHGRLFLIVMHKHTIYFNCFRE